MERLMIFINYIPRASLENIERARQTVRPAQQTNLTSATAAEPQVEGTTAALETNIEQTEGTTKHRPEHSTNCSSTVDDEDNENEVPLEPTSRTNQGCSSSHANHTNSIYNDHPRK